MNLSDFLNALSRQIGSSNKLTKKHIIRFVDEEHYRQCLKQLNIWKPSSSRLSSVKKINIIRAITCSLKSCSELKKYRGIKVEEDVRMSIHAYPMIPYFGRKPAKPFDAGQAIPWGIKQIRAPRLWNQTMGNRVKIGVIDTGADYSHPDLRSSLARGINLIHRHTPPFDDNGHGTHIIGTISAANRASGIVGVAPQASIYPVKAFDHNGTAFVSDIILGIDWCVVNRMDIINMSFGMKNRSQSLFDAVRNAYNSGVIVVASSGNDGSSTSVDYPARFEETISVGATTRTKRVAPFSNRGKWIDVYAPGEKIYSTWVGGRYNELSGTSMATAHVSGTLALLLASKPGLKPFRLKSLLKRAALPLTSKKTALVRSRGQIDAIRAYRYMKGKL